MWACMCVYNNCSYNFIASWTLLWYCVGTVPYIQPFLFIHSPSLQQVLFRMFSLAVISSVMLLNIHSSDLTTLINTITLYRYALFVNYLDCCVLPFTWQFLEGHLIISGPIDLVIKPHIIPLRQFTTVSVDLLPKHSVTKTPAENLWRNIPRKTIL